MTHRGGFGWNKAVDVFPGYSAVWAWTCGERAVQRPKPNKNAFTRFKPIEPCEWHSMPSCRPLEEVQNVLVSQFHNFTADDSPETWARSMPFSAANFLASGLAKVLPFLGVAGVGAATATGATTGAGGVACGVGVWWYIQAKHQISRVATVWFNVKTYFRLKTACTVTLHSLIHYLSQQYPRGMLESSRRTNCPANYAHHPL